MQTLEGRGTSKGMSVSMKSMWSRAPSLSSSMACRESRASFGSLRTFPAFSGVVEAQRLHNTGPRSDSER